MTMQASINTFESYADFLNRLRSIDQQASAHRSIYSDTNNNSYITRTLSNLSAASNTNNNTGHQARVQQSPPVKANLQYINNKNGENTNRASKPSNIATSSSSVSVRSNSTSNNYYELIAAATKQAANTASSPNNFLAQSYRSNQKPRVAQVLQPSDEYLRNKLRHTVSTTQRSNSKSSIFSESFHDKITDQKFFDRNFKLKPQSTAQLSTSNSFDQDIMSSSMVFNGSTSNNGNNRNTAATPAGGRLSVAAASPTSNHHIVVNNETSSLHTGQSMPTTPMVMMNGNIPINYPVSAGNNVQTKLKLLKKRNALKKTLSNLTKTITSSLNSSSQGNMNVNGGNKISAVNQTGTAYRQVHFDREELSKSQNSINHASSSQTNRPISMHFSRNSLAPESNMHKSSETLNDADLVESEAIIDLKLKSASGHFNYNPGNNNKGKSTTNIDLIGSINNKAYGAQIRTKSENELNRFNPTKNDNYYNISSASNNFSMTKPQMPSYSSNLTSLRSNSKPYFTSKALNIDASPQQKLVVQQSRSPSRLDNNFYNSLNIKSSVINRNVKTSRASPTRSGRPSNHNLTSSSNLNFASMNNFNQVNRDQYSEESEYENAELIVSRMNVGSNTAPVSKFKPDEFKITLPGCFNDIVKPGPQYAFDMNLELEQFEPSPYNIMSDPVISEQFRKLYEEDEYFRAIHRKCVEWLVKYVYPELEREKQKERGGK